MKKLYDILKEARIVPKGISFSGGSPDHFNQINSIISKAIANIISDNNYYRNNMGVVEAMFEDRVLGPLVEKYIKSKMIETNAEIVRGGESDIVTRANVSLLTDKELLEFVEDNKEVQLYLARLFWRSYLDSIDIGDIRKLVSKYYGSDYENEYVDSKGQFSYKDIEDLIYYKLENEYYGTDSFPDSESYFASNEFVDYAQRELQKNLLEARIVPAPMASLKRADLVKKLQDYYDVDPEFFHSFDIMSKDEINTPKFSNESLVVNTVTVGEGDILVDYYKKYKKIYVDGEDCTEEFVDYVTRFTDIKLDEISEARVMPVGMKPKYITLSYNKNGSKNLEINSEAIANYLKSVIDPEEIESVDSFMDDSEGYDESSTYFFDGFNRFEDAAKVTDQEVEDWARQEMSYWLTSKPDGFPFKNNLDEARVVPASPIKTPDGWSKWDKSSIDEYNENNYDEDAEEFGYDPYDPYGELIEAYEAPMEGWDKTHSDVIYIFKKINGKFNVMGNYAFGDFISEGEYNSFYGAQKRAVELMEELKKDWE